jgi:WD40 repeat protein
MESYDTDNSSLNQDVTDSGTNRVPARNDNDRGSHNLEAAAERQFEWHYIAVLARQVSFYDVAYQSIKSIRSVNRITASAVSPDGTVAVATKSGVERYDPETWQLLSLYPVEYAIAVAFDSSGVKLAATGWNYFARRYQLHIVCVATGVILWTMDGSEKLSKILFSPCGTTILVQAGAAGIVCADGSSPHIRYLRHKSDGPTRDIAVNPTNNGHIAIAGTNVTAIWDYQQPGREPLLILDEYSFSVAYSPDGSRLASVTRDDHIDIWDSYSGLRLHSLKSSYIYPMSIEWSPDGMNIAVIDTADGFEAFISDVLDGTVVAECKGLCHYRPSSVVVLL